MHARPQGGHGLEGHPVDVDGLAAAHVCGSSLFTGTLAMFTSADFNEIGAPTAPVL